MQVCPFDCMDMISISCHMRGGGCIMDCCQCRSFVLTPSDGSITNKWLVQNGTKCGTNQVHIIFTFCSNVRIETKQFTFLKRILLVKLALLGTFCLQICLSTQCLALTNLNLPSCPVGSNGLVCSGNGV